MISPAPHTMPFSPHALGSSPLLGITAPERLRIYLDSPQPLQGDTFAVARDLAAARAILEDLRRGHFGRVPGGERRVLETIAILRDVAAGATGGRGPLGPEAASALLRIPVALRKAGLIPPVLKAAYEILQEAPGSVIGRVSLELFDMVTAALAFDPDVFSGFAAAIAGMIPQLEDEEDRPVRPMTRIIRDVLGGPGLFHEDPRISMACAEVFDRLRPPSSSAAACARPDFLSAIRKSPREPFSEDEVLALFDNLQHPAPEISDLAARCLGRALRDGRFRSLMGPASSRLGQRGIEFGDNGLQYSTVSPFMESFLEEDHSRERSVRLDEFPVEEGRKTLTELLSSRGITGPAVRKGRSDVYPLSDPEEGILVVKYAREDQAAGELARELQAQTAVRGLPIRSRLPEPLSLFRFEGRPAIAFVAPKDYYRYLDDPALTDGEFLSGLTAAVHDMFLLARHDLFHVVPITLFHNREERRRYLTAPEIVNETWGRGFGTGRLDNWPEAIRHANMGVTGMRDLEEIATRHEILQEGRFRPELRKMRKRPNAGILQEAMVLGDVLLAVKLLMGNRIALQAGDAWEEAWRDERRIRKYADWLLQVFAAGYAGRRAVSDAEARKRLETRADWSRFARQLAFFMTKAYVPYLKEGADPRDFPESIYGKGVVLKGVRRTPFGPYRAGTFHADHGFVGPDGDPAKRALGPVNGPNPVKEFDRAFWGVFL